jgi:hypothetical protein
VLAEQALQQVVYPATIDQGMRETCAIASVEKKVALEDPGEYVRLIADTASNGSYVNAKGKRFDLVETGVPQIDDQAAIHLQRGLPSPFKEVGDNNRSWASKIFQQTAANILLYERSNGFIKYVDRGDHEAQVAVNDPHSRTIVFNRGGAIEPLRSPVVVQSSDYETMFQGITGKDEHFFFKASIHSRPHDTPVVLGNQ